jgi:hypothetical protein
MLSFIDVLLPGKNDLRPLWHIGNYLSENHESFLWNEIEFYLAATHDLPLTGQCQKLETRSVATIAVRG